LRLFLINTDRELNPTSSATYGLPHGGRKAYVINLDAWGGLGYQDIYYNFSNIQEEKVIDQFKGLMIKDSYDHQYAKVTKSDIGIWILANRAFEQKLEIQMNGQFYEFKFNL